MLTGPEDFRELWEAIKHEMACSEEQKVTIFVSTQDCDSVCAIRIMQVTLVRAFPCRSVTVPAALSSLLKC